MWLTKPTTHVTFNNLYETPEQKRSYGEPDPVSGPELGELVDDDLLEVSSAIESEIEDVGDPGWGLVARRARHVAAAGIVVEGVKVEVEIGVVEVESSCMSDSRW
jgi:hypothetical protein